MNIRILTFSLYIFTVAVCVELSGADQCRTPLCASSSIVLGSVLKAAMAASSHGVDEPLKATAIEFENAVVVKDITTTVTPVDLMIRNDPNDFSGSAKYEAGNRLAFVDDLSGTMPVTKDQESIWSAATAFATITKHPSASVSQFTSTSTSVPPTSVQSSVISEQPTSPPMPTTFATSEASATPLEVTSPNSRSTSAPLNLGRLHSLAIKARSASPTGAPLTGAPLTGISTASHTQPSEPNHNYYVWPINWDAPKRFGPDDSRMISICLDFNKTTSVKRHARGLWRRQGYNATAQSQSCFGWRQDDPIVPVSFQLRYGNMSPLS